MKYHRWTVSLAALGFVTLGPAAHAEEKANVLQTALASTTISGYVDTSAQWNFGTGNANVAPYKFNSPSKSEPWRGEIATPILTSPERQCPLQSKGVRNES